MRTFYDHVRTLCIRYPSLLTLCRFLTDPEIEQQPCRISAFRFSSMTKRPLNSNIDPRHLRSELLRHGSSGQIWPDEEARIAQDMLGEILIVEDLTKDVIETLGSVLNIDPLFFAKHLTDSNFTFSDHLTPPSRSWLKGYLNIFYHRVVSIEGQKMPTSSPLQFSRNSNVSRKVVVLPPMGKTKIALVQHCCSILMLTRKDGTWLGES